MVKVSHYYWVSPSDMVVLMHHVLYSEDAENDADRMVEELAMHLDHYKGYVGKGVFESALYCCNMENERGNFWHPLGMKFDAFLERVIPLGQRFDKYYNVILVEKP